MNFYKKCTARPYSSLVKDATLALENPLSFRKNLLQNLIVAIYDKIRDNINVNISFIIA